MVLEARTAAGPYRQTIAVQPSAGGFLRQRYGALAVDALEAAGAERNAIVRASLGG